MKTTIAILSALLCLNACTTVHFQSESGSFDRLSSDNSIVLLSNRESSEDFDDDDVEDCIGPAMYNVNQELRFVPAKQFRRNLYPYFAPSTTPHDLEGYKNVLAKPEVRQRIDSLGVRYLIILTKGGTNTKWHGGIICGAGYGGGGCLGLSWWDRKSELGLAIWDLHAKVQAVDVQAQAKGKGVMPAFGLPIPVYVPATRSAVCKALGTRLAKLLSGQK
ncbi:MAG TPA: hypothetical protein DCZ04_05810 [Syntrophorhabdus aromaticivorans]|nr:hypothetical protein [Syntrophorhabdus aromaticivorans]